MTETSLSLDKATPFERSANNVGHRSRRWNRYRGQTRPLATHSLCILDGADVQAGKPDPECFLSARHSFAQAASISSISDKFLKAAIRTSGQVG